MTTPLDDKPACCPNMEQQLHAQCDLHSPWECPDVVVVRRADGTYGPPIRDGENGSASSSYAVWHCPWYGSRLPGHVVQPAPDHD